MTGRIAQVVLMKAGADGSLARWVIDGGNEPSDVRARVLEGLRRPTRTVRTELDLDDGQVVRLPFKDFAYLLPDRSGVLAIFMHGSYTHPDGSDVFPYPNNAAIFNADGSLRFQLKVVDPRVHHIDCLHGGTLPEKFEGMLGVLVAYSENDTPAWAYAVNSEHPDLIDAMQWVRY